MNEFIKRASISLELASQLKKSGMLNNPRIARTLLSLHMRPDPEMELKLLENINFISSLDPTSPFNQPDESVLGAIGIAIAENSLPISLNPQECHSLIAGQTGVGKTILLILTFSQALALGQKIWMFVRAPDTRCLLDIDKNILVIKLDEKFKINILNPCGMPFTEYCNIFADIFIQSQKLYDGTKNYLIEHLITLYKRFEKYNRYPSLHDLYYYIKSLKHPISSRTGYFRESCLNRFGGIIHGSLGHVFDCSVGHEETLLSHNCIFEIGSLTREQQILLVNLLITKLFHKRLKTSPDNWVFVGIDDGNLLFDISLEKRPDLGLPIIHDLLSTVRKSLIHIICCTQTPHQLGASIHSNAQNKIMFSLANGNDIDFMHKSIGNLTPEQKAFCYKLQARQVIIKNTVRFPEPVFGVIPEIPELRIIDDIEITENNERILSLFPAVMPRRKKEESVQAEKQENINTPKPVSEQTRTFLMTVYLYQYQKTLTEISKITGLSAGTGSRIAKDAEKRNLIKIVQIKFRRGNPKYPVLLPDAYKILGISEKHFYGKGAGYEHILYQHLIASHYSNYKPIIEFFRNGKHIDVAIETNEYLFCVEVAVSAVHEKINLIKDFEKAKADFIVIACKDNKVKSKVDAILSSVDASLQDKFKTILISEFLNIKADEFIDNLIERKNK